MDITLHKKSNIEGHIKIKLIPGDYQPKVDEKVKEYSRKANIKGFRKGKVPAGIINKLYGKSIKADEINHLISHSLNDYIKEKDLQLLGDPIPEFEKTEDIDWENQSEFEFEFAIGMVDDFTYEVSPGVKLKKYVIELNDETLQSSIKDIRKQHGKMNNPDTVEDGDVIYCNWRLNSMREFLAMMRCLTIFTPPAVEPADPPINIKVKNIKATLLPQVVKSELAKPVVVNTDTT